METQYKELGKVCLTPEGFWDKTKEYERISIVTNTFNNRSYISRKDVPVGIDINNKEYWQIIGAAGYKDNNIIILSDIDEDTNKLYIHTLNTAIYSIADEDKRPGLILGFYGKDYKSTQGNTWYLYQFNSDNVDDWYELSCWTTIYDNVSKFKGYFLSEAILLKEYPIPAIGDFAFVGEDLDSAVIYSCIETGIWKVTNSSALDFADKYKAVYSKDFGEFKNFLDETYADRATKDALGRIIHDTYVTREALSVVIAGFISDAINDIQLPDECINMNHLSESVVNFIGSGGNVVNNPDDEDITVKDNKLKFADKEYNEHTFGGYGRVYLRKNMTDGLNLLEQHMINKENTIYYVQYDYCLNEETIELPKGCILVFNGGSFNKGTIILNEVYVKDMFGMLDEFNRITFKGDFKEGQLKFDKDSISYKIYKNHEWQSIN